MVFIGNWKKPQWCYHLECPLWASHAVLLIQLQSVWTKICLCWDCLSKDFCIWRVSGSRSWDAPNKYIFSSWKWCRALENHLIKKKKVRRVSDGVSQKTGVIWGQEGKEKSKHAKGLMKIQRPVLKTKSTANLHVLSVAPRCMSEFFQTYYN